MYSISQSNSKIKRFSIRICPNWNWFSILFWNSFLKVVLKFSYNNSKYKQSLGRKYRRRKELIGLNKIGENLFSFWFDRTQKNIYELLINVARIKNLSKLTIDNRPSMNVFLEKENKTKHVGIYRTNVTRNTCYKEERKKYRYWNEIKIFRSIAEQK